jgi:hypothetical protein
MEVAAMVEREKQAKEEVEGGEGTGGVEESEGGG